jgi:hypothetical protein
MQFSKAALLGGFSKSVRRRIEEAYDRHELGAGVPIPRDTRPDGSSRAGEHPEWMYRLLEASFAVEDAIEHEQAARAVPPTARPVVDELRRRRNVLLDELGENEVAPALTRPLAERWPISGQPRGNSPRAGLLPPRPAVAPALALEVH